MLEFKEIEGYSTLNSVYIKEKLAMYAEECYRSKMDHIMRMRRKDLKIADSEMIDYQSKL